MEGKVKIFKSVADELFDDNIHLVTEMSTFGREKWGKHTYKIAVHGASTNDRPNPHIHIYYENEKNTVYPQFNFEISLVDILTKDEINLIYQVDKSRNIYISNRISTTQTGYADILKGFKEFLFSTPKPNKRTGTFIDNLDRAIHEWNRETDLYKYETLGENPLLDYLNSR